MSGSRHTEKPSLTAFERHTSATLAVFFTYPVTHTFITPAVRWQSSKFSFRANPVNTWFPSLYSIILQNTWQGFTKQPFSNDILTLYKGYFAGIFYKTLQANLRYPAQQYYLGKIEENSAFDNIAHATKHAVSGSLAAITEAALHPFDSFRNILIKEERNLTLKEKAEILKNTNVKLLNGIWFTIIRNSIGGATQFWLFALLMNHALFEDKKKQISFSALIAGIAMVFVTMPFDNLKLKKQLETVDPLKQKHKFTAWDLFNFRGGFFKASTRSIPPAATMTVVNILNPMLVESRPKRAEFFQLSNDAEPRLLNKDKVTAPENRSRPGMKKSNGE